MKNRLFPVIGVFVVFFTACRASAAVTSQDFGNLPNGSPVTLFTITNQSNAAVKIMTYGATVVSLTAPDRAGKLDDVVLGFDNLNDYLHKSPFFGATVGRYANRIARAQFTLEGTPYHITPNEHGNVLHGGLHGFDKVIWTAKKIDDQTIEFTYLSKDTEEGFPGNLTVHVRDSLSDNNEFKIEYSATTDKPTVINLTNHSYFNLAGQGNGDVLSNQLTIDADQYTPADSHLIPTGKIEPVANTPFDFTTTHTIGQRINADHPQLHGGYDQNFVLTKKDGLRLAATLYEPTTGRLMEVWTTQPALQLYSANGLDGHLTGKDNKTYLHHGAICLETQHFPDSPNEPTFPTTELKPGETFQSTTTYKFKTQTIYDLSTNWTPLQEGEAQGAIETDAPHPTNTDPYLLRITVTKTADRNKGRAGASNSTPISVEQDHWYDVTFTSATLAGSVGLVFSLEGAGGKVLARTTLPEIGRNGRSRSATTQPAWPKYLVALHARAADSAAHLVITPIEPTTIWLDGLKLTSRSTP